MNRPSIGRSGSAHASRTWRWARRPCATSRSRARSSARRRCVVQRQLAARRQERRPPARPGGKLDDLAGPRQGIEPATGRVQLGVPGRVVDRTAGVPAAAEVPVVVLRGARLVVVDHGLVEVGGGRCHGCRRRWRRGCHRRLRDGGHGTGRGCVGPRRRRALAQRLAQPEPEELVVAGLADAVGAELRPALEVVGRARRHGRCRTTGTRRSPGKARSARPRPASSRRAARCRRTPPDP